MICSKIYLNDLQFCDDNNSIFHRLGITSGAGQARRSLPERKAVMVASRSHRLLVINQDAPKSEPNDVLVNKTTTLVSPVSLGLPLFVALIQLRYLCIARQLLSLLRPPFIMQ